MARTRRLDLAGETRRRHCALSRCVALAAGPAVMAEYARGADGARQARRQPGDRRRRAGRGDDSRAVGGLGGADPDRRRRGDRRRRADRRSAERFILVDPLDGTREFIARNGEFTVNVALVERGQPIAGAVYAPALERLWFAGERAFACAAPVGADLPPPRLGGRCALAPRPPALTALASRSHGDPATEAFLAGLPIADRRSAGSSLKFCVIAEGEGDVYPRFGPTMEWDTAAGDAVLRAAGGVVLAVEGGPLVYGKIAAGLRNGGFVAWGDPRAGGARAHR